MDETVLLPRTYTFRWSKKIRKADDFSSVFRLRAGFRGGVFEEQGFKQRGSCLEVLAKPNRLGWARLGLIVPKRILPHAVDRNRAKRQIREAFRHVQHELGDLDTIVRLVGLVEPQDHALRQGGLHRECAQLLQEIRMQSTACLQPKV
jgi:ribonuclease P protein component